MWLSTVWMLLKTGAIAWAVLALVRFGRKLSDRRFYTIVAVAAIVLRVAWLVAVNPPLVGDASWYHLRAIGLAAGQGYVVDGRPTAHFPPAYPLLLSALYYVFGPHPIAGQTVNLLLTIVLIGLTARLGFRLFGPAVGRTAAVLMALWPGQIPYAAVLLAEPLFAVLVLAFILLMLPSEEATRVRRAALAGLLVGLASLLRPVGLGLIALVPALALAWQAGVKRAIWMTVAAGIAIAVVLAPWVCRNAMVFGAFIPLTSSSGLVLWEGNHAGARGLPSDADDDPFKLMPDELLRDRLARIEALAFVRSQPWQAARLYLSRLHRTYERDDEVAEVGLANLVGDATFASRMIHSYGRLCRTYFDAMLLLFSAFLALPILLRRASFVRPWLAVVVPVVFFAGVQAIFLAQYRYNYPTLPFIAVGVACVLNHALSKRVSATTQAATTNAAIGA
jgi:hypothetical protein